MILDLVLGVFLAFLSTLPFQYLFEHYKSNDEVIKMGVSFKEGRKGEKEKFIVVQLSLINWCLFHKRHLLTLLRLDAATVNVSVKPHFFESSILKYVRFCFCKRGKRSLKIVNLIRERSSFIEN